jgi:uncharacterized membrane protein YphA (DoxX/SURF4 family)
MRNSKKTNALLWTIQVLLAALFLFAGVMKFVMPAEQLTAQSPFSAGFIRFIGVAEILGALGLVLPGLTRIQTRLTPLAASGLVIIMIGATALTIQGGLAALFPFAVGVLAAFVAYGRWRVAPHREVSRATVQPRAST